MRLRMIIKMTEVVSLMNLRVKKNISLRFNKNYFPRDSLQEKSNKNVFSTTELSR